MTNKVFQANGINYPINKPIMFTPHGYGSKLFKNGIHRVEQGCFAWTKDSSFEFEMDLGTEEDLVVQMDFRMIYHGMQRLVAFANDRNVFRGNIEYPSVRFCIPKEAMECGRVKLTLMYPDASSPAMNMESNDKRILAFGIRKIIVMDMEHAIQR